MERKKNREAVVERRRHGEYCGCLFFVPQFDFGLQSNITPGFISEGENQVIPCSSSRIFFTYPHMA